ncbi:MULTISPECIES: hypothetical protein [unclassified Cyanobium]|uniref:hypothetical protein n=1 Tax=unclassified Cyanobium TaxID=2627006 RepID=UPI001862978F|nr:MULTISPECIES: hypothetical protein [unclassified Cyanobium]QNI70201.1 hypothetical protein CyaNS01_01062 [Cyanobium sp. NS01]
MNLRLDRINSQQVVLLARRALFSYMERCPGGPDPCGVVLQAERGRVVLEMPVLLPDEQFIPIELIRGRLTRGGGSRLRWARPS